MRAWHSDQVDDDALWPDLPVPELPRCARCGHRVPTGKLVDGRYGEDCAEKLGLTVATPRVRADPQTGPDLFTSLDE